ncbi:MAG: dipeptidase, partial [Glutamicibacter sp.]
MTENTTFDAVASGVDIAALKSHIDTNFEKILEELTSLVAIPSIAWESFDPQNLEKSAAAVAELAKSAGMETVEILREPAQN